MIYIIDNGEPYDDHELHFVEVSEHEKELFGEALEPILLSAKWSQPFVAGLTQDIVWRIQPKFAEHHKTIPFSEFIHILNLVELSDDYQIVERLKSIPPLSWEASNYIINHHIKNFPSNKDRYMDFIHWDDVRLALMEAECEHG